MERKVIYSINQDIYEDIVDLIQKLMEFNQIAIILTAKYQ
jgi:hypothetical protein